MKKKCLGCRALCGTGVRAYCDIGFNMTFKQVKYLAGGKAGVTLEHIPLEDCPKPKTLSEYSEAVYVRRLTSKKIS